MFLRKTLWIMFVGLLLSQPAYAQILPSEASDQSVLNSPSKSTNLPQLIDLGADKCIPCKMMAPILDELEKEYAGIMMVRFIDVWKEKEQAKLYRIKMIPTQIFYDKDGKELYRHQGFIGKEDILSTWRTLGYNFEAN